MKRLFLLPLALTVVLLNQHVFAQDSVDVTFRYTNGSASSAYLVGEFNGWSNSSWPMVNRGGGLWTRTARFPVGINPNADPVKGIATAWQYKFYYSGASTWPNDPVEHHVNAGDNNNSYVYVRNPTIYQLIPNQRGATITTPTPQISAFIYPKVGSSLDTSALRLIVDGSEITGIGAAYDSASQKFAYTLSTPLLNGSHVVILQAGLNADTVSFYAQTGYVQITTQGGFATRNPLRQLRGVVQNSGVSSIKLVRNGSDTTIAAVSNGAFAVTDTLVEGWNAFRAIADSNGNIASSDSIAIRYVVDHAPRATMGFTQAGPQIVFYADGTTDPDSGETAVLTYRWHADASNPAAVAGAEGNTAKTFLVSPPTVSGDYFFSLIVADPEGNADTVRNYFTIEQGGGVTIQSLASNPAWARTGRIYFLFPKGASSAGTLTEAATKLQYIKDLGFSIIWLMPVMKNAYPINNGTGPGYNIVDFYTVAPEYGGNAAFASFMQQAHALGLKVILDVTPNHTGRNHPWCIDAHTYKQDSRYWTWYEHGLITSNTNNLGDNLDADGFNYYGGFSEQLMNYNWADIDARTEMINAYKYWITQYGVDGYRFDVYWGPHRRYGEAAMGYPVRRALKHIKPDILLLAEDNGTGSGSEVIFSDYTNGSVIGGVDAAYDFNLYWNAIYNFTFDAASLSRLHNQIENSGYYPGKNALYMRYLESQDEDRIVYLYSKSSALTSFKRTMPLATVLFTAPGLPMIWNGQEVGWGYGISGSKETRARSVIEWNYQGRPVLAPHYQRLATLRGKFPAFTTHKTDTNSDGSINGTDAPDIVRISSGNSYVYAFTRPYLNQNGLAVVNVADTDQTVTLDLSAANALKFQDGVNGSTVVYVNELLSATTTTRTVGELSALPVSLSGYGSAVYTVSLTRDSLGLLNSILGVAPEPEVASTFGLMQNYPNPFNPTTNIRYQISEIGHLKLAVYDMLGREVAVLVDGVKEPGYYQVEWNAAGMASGVYYYRLTAGASVEVKKMLLLR
jgi:cyclomaltodextrinase / maltogenic alpha-amylase / neopullulanase